MPRARRHASNELTLYAIARPPLPSTLGVAGARLQVFAVGSIAVIAAPASRPSAAIEAALRAQHGIVVALARRVDPLLPVRYGTRATIETLGDLLRPSLPRLDEALDRVGGRRQMTVRILGPRPLGRPPTVVTSGRAYLAERMAGTAPVPDELARLVASLRPFVVDQRLRLGRGDIRATLYHLIEKGDVSRYSRVLAAALQEMPPWRGVVSGPWPPFAFAPDPL